VEESGVKELDRRGFAGKTSIGRHLPTVAAKPLAQSGGTRGPEFKSRRGRLEDPLETVGVS